MKDDRAHNNESPTIHLRDSSVEEMDFTDGNNLYQMIIPGTLESNAFDLESNSGAKVPQIEPAERSKVAGTTAGKNHSKTINSSNKGTNAFGVESNSRKKALCRKRAGRLKVDSAYHNDLSTIELHDSVAGDVGIATGNNLYQIMIPANEESIVLKLKVQKGFKDNSVVLCPKICLHDNSLLQEDFHSNCTAMHEPHVHGKIIQVSNRKTNATDYAIEFDTEKTLDDGLTYEDLFFSMTFNTNTKKILKRGVERTNIIDYRCKKNEKSKHAEA